MVYISPVQGQGNYTFPFIYLKEKLSLKFKKTVVPIKNFSTAVFLWDNAVVFLSLSYSSHIIKKRGEDGYKLISVGIKENKLSELDKIAAETNYLCNELINMILNHGVKIL